MTKYKFSKITAVFLTFFLIFGAVFGGVSAAEGEFVVLGGTLFGVELDLDGILVTDLAPFASGGEEISPAAEAGILPGDFICEVSGARVHSLSDLKEALERSGGKPMSVGVLREEKTVYLLLCAKKSDESGSYQLGLMAKEKLSGIGTLTYYRESDGSFGGLGHGICSSESDTLFPVEIGKVSPAKLKSVVVGKAGSPGELVASFDRGTLGTLSRNTDCGVFGSLNAPPKGERVEIAGKDCIKEGAAKLVCTVSGEGLKTYDVKISEIVKDGSKTKNFIVTVTDEALLEKTGGIVQGMSGSPILQDGKLVGALTHVLVRHPTRGYGIFIENMLEAA